MCHEEITQMSVYQKTERSLGMIETKNSRKDAATWAGVLTLILAAVVTLFGVQAPLTSLNTGFLEVLTIWGIIFLLISNFIIYACSLGGKYSVFGHPSLWGMIIILTGLVGLLGSTESFTDYMSRTYTWVLDLCVILAGYLVLRDEKKREPT